MFDVIDRYRQGQIALGLCNSQSASLATLVTAVMISETYKLPGKELAGWPRVAVGEVRHPSPASASTTELVSR